MRLINRHSARRMLIFLLVLAILWVLFIWVAQRRVLFPTGLIPASLHVEPGPGVEVIWLEPPDLAGGKVEGWFIPGAGVSPERPGPVVFYAHGNGELIDLWHKELTRYTEMGVSVFLAEYRGYGRSDGSPSEAGILEDFTAFHDLLAARPDVDPERVVFHGRSLGGAAVAALSRRRPPAAMILESTFTDVAAMARRFLVPALLVRDRFDSVAALRGYDRPVLIVHGEHDEVVPIAHARRLHDAAPNSRLVFFDMSHNTPPPTRDYWATVEAFLIDAQIVDAPQTAE